ncbi:MAG: DedA family protein [Thermoleophilaceae bacterium]
MLIPVPAALGYPTLGALVFGESTGLPLPGETALITAGGLAAAGHLSLPLVIVVATLAAIAGDTLGYWLGRERGRAFLLRDGFLAGHRRHAVRRADRFFARNGTATVFVSRFIPGVRVVAAVMAGATGMPWRRFAAANMLGAVLWASTVASLAYLLGPAGAASLALAGLALGPLALTGAWWRRRRTRAREVIGAPA